MSSLLYLENKDFTFLLYINAGNIPHFTLDILVHIDMIIS